jgi:hypothetical protein
VRWGRVFAEPAFGADVAVRLLARDGVGFDGFGDELADVFLALLEDELLDIRAAALLFDSRRLDPLGKVGLERQRLAHGAGDAGIDEPRVAAAESRGRSRRLAVRRCGRDGLVPHRAGDLGQLPQPPRMPLGPLLPRIGRRGLG